MSWNVNGLRSVIKKNILQEYINDKKFDIICVNETKISQEKIEMLENQIPREYIEFYNCSKINKNHSGVAIFTKFEPIKIIYDMNNHNNEGRMITLEYEKMYIVCCYTPNSARSEERYKYRIEQWDRDFRKFIKKIIKKKTTIICGDLNVAYQPIDTYFTGLHEYAGYTKDERKNFGKLLNIGLVDIFREFYPNKKKYTWWDQKWPARSKNKGWRFDYILIDNESFNIVKNIKIRNDIYGSDHCPIEIIINNE